MNSLDFRPGNALGAEWFTENDFGTSFVFFFMTELAFTTLAFFFSTLTLKAEAARSIGFLWYFLTFISAPVLHWIYFYADPDNPGDEDDIEIRNGLALIPALPFWKGCRDLLFWSSGKQMTGLSWDKVDESHLREGPMGRGQPGGRRCRAARTS